MTITNKDFRTWLTEQYHEQAHSYRVALEREVEHTRRIFGGTIPADARRLLLQSLKEIPVPKLHKYPYKDNEQNLTVIYNKVPKPNFHLILREVVEKI